MKSVYKKAAKIKLVILDIDGVLTDGMIYMSPEGEAFQAFNVKDGRGIQDLEAIGVSVAVMSGRSSASARHRLERLGVTEIHQGLADKIPTLNRLVDEKQVTLDQVAYIGDDTIDIDILKMVGLPVAPQDAHKSVLTHAAWVTPHGGGKGAVRDLCDLIVEAQS